jgi:S1-C subfamily serine protease
MELLRLLSSELESLVGRTAPAVVSVEHHLGEGSGIVFRGDGLVLTNAHVVVRARGALRIGFQDGSAKAGEIAGIDRRTDLAIVRVKPGPGEELPHLALAARDTIHVGQLVVAIGNPLRFERSVSLGVVSALDRSLHGPDGGLVEGLIQTDAAINPGNSGGPLVNAEGAVVGISTAIIPYAQGIGFAVPAATASWVASVLVEKGEIRRPFLGIAARGVLLAPHVAAELGQMRALRVFEVNAETPAAAAGLEDGDLLVAANGTPLASVDDLQRVMVLAGRPEVDIAIFRARERRSVVVRPRPAAAA